MLIGVDDISSISDQVNELAQRVLAESVAGSKLVGSWLEPRSYMASRYRDHGVRGAASQ